MDKIRSATPTLRRLPDGCGYRGRWIFSVWCKNFAAPTARNPEIWRWDKWSATRVRHHGRRRRACRRTRHRDWPGSEPVPKTTALPTVDTGDQHGAGSERLVKEFPLVTPRLFEDVFEGSAVEAHPAGDGGRRKRLCTALLPLHRPRPGVEGVDTRFLGRSVTRIARVAEPVLGLETPEIPNGGGPDDLGSVVSGGGDEPPGESSEDHVGLP